jgi:hypothetical protein
VCRTIVCLSYKLPGASPRALLLGGSYSSDLVTCRCLAPAYHAWLVEVCLCMTLSCKDFLLHKKKKKKKKKKKGGSSDGTPYRVTKKSDVYRGVTYNCLVVGCRYTDWSCIQTCSTNWCSNQQPKCMESCFVSLIRILLFSHTRRRYVKGLVCKY